MKSKVGMRKFVKTLTSFLFIVRFLLCRSRFLSFAVVKEKYSARDENEGYNKAQRSDVARLVGKENESEKDAENGCHKVENGDTGYGIMLKKDTPERVCDSRKERKVYKV